MLLFAACKYEDGPVISFRSKTKRLCHEWKVDNLKIDGIDSTQRYKDSCNCNIEIEYYKKPSERASQNILLWKCIRTPGVCCPYGEWSLKHNKKTFDVNITSCGGFIGFGPIREGEGSWNILKLTNENFWFEATYKGKEYEFKLTWK